MERSGLVVVFTPIPMSVGWIAQASLTWVSWIQLANLDQKSKLTPLTWVFLVLAGALGTLAYTLTLAGVSNTIAGLIAGIVGGGSLTVAGRVAKR